MDKDAALSGAAFINAMAGNNANSFASKVDADISGLYDAQGKGQSTDQTISGKRIITSSPSIVFSSDAVGMLKITLPRCTAPEDTVVFYRVRLSGHSNAAYPWLMESGGQYTAGKGTWANCFSVSYSGTMGVDLIRFWSANGECGLLIGHTASVWTNEYITIEQVSTPTPQYIDPTNWGAMELLTKQDGLTIGQFYNAANTPGQNGIVRPTWQNLTFQNGVTSLSGVKFCKMGGICFVNGSFVPNRTDGNFYIGILPSGYRPISSTFVHLMSNQQKAVWLMLAIHNTGYMTVQPPPIGGEIVSNAYYYIYTAFPAEY